MPRTQLCPPTRCTWGQPHLCSPEAWPLTVCHQTPWEGAQAPGGESEHELLGSRSPEDYASASASASSHVTCYFCCNTRRGRQWGSTLRGLLGGLGGSSASLSRPDILCRAASRCVSFPCAWPQHASLLTLFISLPFYVLSLSPQLFMRNPGLCSSRVLPRAVHLGTSQGSSPSWVCSSVFLSRVSFGGCP